jgi:hypothetical protein
VTGNRGDLGKDLVLVGDRRAAQLDRRGSRSSGPAHVVYSAFSITYSSVRSQPKASPGPSPGPAPAGSGSRARSIASRAAARSNRAGPPAGPSNTRWPAIAIRRMAGSRVTGLPPRSAASAGLRPAADEDGCVGQMAVAGRRRDPAPVGVAAVGRGLDQRAADHRPGDRPGIGVVDCARHLAGQQGRGALAVGSLLAGEIAGDTLRRPGPAGAPRRSRPGSGRSGWPPRRGRRRCRWCSCRHPP